MRLKVSPKEALTRIDDLLLQGYLLAHGMDEFSALPDSFSVAGDSLKETGKRRDWHVNAVLTLQEIFLDFAPVFAFVCAWERINNTNAAYSWAYQNQYRKEQLLAGLDVLNEYCKKLSAQIFIPLFYIPNKAQICFFASVCPLEPDSNESTLCRYMFQKYSYHERAEMIDVFSEGFGSRKNFDGRDRAMIKNAYDGVNRKTNAAFDFHVFKKNGATICINLPARFLREEQSGKAL